MEKLIEVLNSGGVAVMKTDTIYGIVASAFAVDAVEKIYDLKKRDRSKACIVLISEISNLERFGVEYRKYADSVLSYRTICYSSKSCAICMW